jgi:hypothetical protein
VIPSNDALPTGAEFVVSLLVRQHEQFFGLGTENGAPSAAQIFQTQLSLNNFLNRRHAHQEVLKCASTSALAKGYL